MNPFIKLAASTAAIIGVFTSSALANYSVGTVTGSNVNLRSGAGTDQPIVATVPLNTQLTVMGNNSANGDGTWLQAQYDGQVVWVSGMYVSLSPEKATLYYRDIGGCLHKGKYHRSRWSYSSHQAGVYG